MSLINYANYLHNLENKDDNDTSIFPVEVPTQDSFLFPRVSRPKEFIEKCEKSGIDIKFNKGTTTLAFVYQHGVVVAVDSRATAGGYIASQTVKKIIEINRYMLGTMAGGAADCSFWQRVLSRECRLFELRNGTRITVGSASKILSNVLSYYKNMGLSMGTMICGWDLKGPSIYYVEDSGARFSSNLFSVGSGSTYAYSVLDSLHSHKLTTEEAIELGKRAIYHATYRDAMSGGTVNVYHINQNGWENVGSHNVADLHEIYGNKQNYPL